MEIAMYREIELNVRVRSNNTVRYLSSSFGLNERISAGLLNNTYLRAKYHNILEFFNTGIGIKSKLFNELAKMDL